RPQLVPAAQTAQHRLGRPAVSVATLSSVRSSGTRHRLHSSGTRLRTDLGFRPQARSASERAMFWILATDRAICFLEFHWKLRRSTCSKYSRNAVLLY